MSLTPHSGLLGVSSHTSFVVPGFSAAASVCKSSESTKSTLSPKAGASVASHARKAQYMPLGATTLAHGLVVGAAVGIAAAIKIVGITLEGRGEMDRRHNRAGALVDGPQRLGGQ